MAATVAGTLDAIGMTVVTEMILALHLLHGVLPRHPRGTVMTVRRVDVNHHLTVAVPLPLPDRGMTTGATGTGIGTWIDAGGMIRVIVTEVTRRGKIGTKETTGAGTIIGFGP